MSSTTLRRLSHLNTKNNRHELPILLMGAVALSAGSLTYLLLFKENVLAAGVPLELFIVLCAAFACIALGITSSISFRHFSARYMLGRLSYRMGELDELVTSTYRLLDYYENRTVDYSKSVGMRNHSQLAKIRRIASALDKRYRDVKDLMSMRRYDKLVLAYNLFYLPLYFSKNGLRNVIDTEPIPPLNCHHWAPAIEALFTEFERAISRNAAGVENQAGASS